MPSRPPSIRVVPRAKRESRKWKQNPEGSRLTGRKLQRRNKRILERDQYTCQNVQCGHVGIDLHVDHKVPIARGGTDEDSNLQALCIGCNQAKGLAESRGEVLPDPTDFDPARVRYGAKHWSNRGG